MDQSILQTSEADLGDIQNESAYFRLKAEPTVSEKLKRKESSHIKEKILNFIRDVQNSKIPSDSKLPQRLMELIDDAEDNFQQLWNESDDVAQENGEFFEKIITKPIYQILISLFDDQRDKNLEFSFKVFDFVELKHLETDEEIKDHPKFDFVVTCTKLSKIDTYAAPREKLLCIMNACKMISRAMLNSQSKNNTPTGADNFLPVLIYAVLQARPQNPFSNIEYISKFRSPRRIAGAEEYYFTAYESALEFIESLDHNKLKITAQEFKKLCSERVDGIKYDQEVPEEGQFQFDAYQNYINLQMLRMKLAEIEKTAKFSAVLKKPKLKFATRSYQDIGVGDLPEFFQEYQILIKNNMDLQKQLEGVQRYTDQIIRESQKQRSKSKQNKRFFGLL